MAGKKESNKRIVFAVLVSACITGLIILLTFILEGNMGFGSSSLTIMDGEVQYVDFFNYLKDVLSGTDSIAYTFNKGLGGTGVALFAYYLASPLNLIVMLLPKGAMPIATDILFLIKTVLASAFCALALAKRFPELKKSFVIFLSVGYSLMHWNLVQSSNIMWLDGAYMLPLIMLSVYILVRQGNPVWLSFTLGLSIMFNWYTGAFNCIFAVCAFIVEMVIFSFESKESGIRIKAGGRVLWFIVSMALAMALSMVLFLPNFLALRAGKGSAFDLHGLIGGLTANPLSIIQNNAAGVYNFRGLGSASVFCGSLVIISVVTLFRSKYFKIKEKILAGAVVLFGLLTFFIRPFYYIMCLLKSVESYEFRHEYMIIMMFVCLAGWYLSRTAGRSEEPADGAETFRKEMSAFFQDAVIIAVLMAGLNLIFPNNDRDIIGIIVSAAALIIMGLCLYLKARGTLKETAGKAISALFCVAVIGELFAQSFLTIRLYNNDNDLVGEYAAYAESMEELKEELNLAAEPAGNFRFSETDHRTPEEGQGAACLNDGLAFNIMTNATYSSCTENVQIQLMDRLGYKNWAGVLNVVNTSIVPADSLLGVNYIASDEEIFGLEPIPTEKTFAGRKLYENPFALPLVYTVKDTGFKAPEDAGNSFDYINGLYRELTGDSSLEVFTASGESPYYVQLVGNFKANVVSDGKKLNEYGSWLSDKVVYIPGKDFMIDVVEPGEDMPIQAENVIIRRLNVEDMQKATEQILSADTVTDLVIENGYISALATSDGKCSLITSVPATDGWTISVNGKKTEPERFADALIKIPLEEGENRIVMSFEVPGFKAGTICSAAALIILIILEILLRARSK